MATRSCTSNTSLGARQRGKPPRRENVEGISGRCNNEVDALTAENRSGVADTLGNEGRHVERSPRAVAVVFGRPQPDISDSIYHLFGRRAFQLDASGPDMGSLVATIVTAWPDFVHCRAM